MTFDIALSGLNAASKELEVISNNIANNATTGFKGSRAEFADVYASTTENATGQGVTIANVRQTHTSGNFSNTGKPLDLAINGQGFFQVIKDGDVSYTRNGTFSLDREGFIVNSVGHALSGYDTLADGFLSPTVGPVQIKSSDLAPRATELTELGLNLDSTMEVLPAFDVDDPKTYNFTTATTIYDSLGSPNVMTMYFHKDTPNTWSMFTHVEDQEVSQAGGDELVFTTDGVLQTINGGTSKIVALPSFNPPSGGSPIELELELSEVSQYNGDFGVNQIIQDGYTNGRLNNLEIEDNGRIMGRYSNGQSQVMGQIALSNFTNLDGLEQIFGTGWKETLSSGAALTGTPGSASLGSIRAGSLEDSNVDITEELVAMIGAQRSFQANAQVITTADTINQTVINMRR